MKNPFQYGGVVGGEAFCNRTKELADLLRAMENSEKLFLYSERRYGKTSLARLAQERLPAKQFLTAYVDLWPTDGEASFAAAIAKALTESVATTAKKMLDTAKTLFGWLRPSVSMDDEGRPQITFGVGRDVEADPQLDNVLAALPKLAARGKKVVVVFDEFQRILEYGSDRVERRLRSIIQHHQSVSYIFLGSRKHLIQQMFLDKSRPLYRAAGHYPLPAIDEKDWLPFVRKRFLATGKQIADEQIHSVCRLTEGHPFYTQHLCHTLWELCEPGVRATEDMVGEAVRVLVDRESYAYTTLWESLAANQQRFLRGLSREPRGFKPFASDFTRRYGLRSASNAQRAVEALLARDVIDHDNGSFCIVDRFFKLWIQRNS